MRELGRLGGLAQWETWESDQVSHTVCVVTRCEWCVCHSALQYLTDSTGTCNTDQRGSFDSIVSAN